MVAGYLESLTSLLAVSLQQMLPAATDVLCPQIKGDDGMQTPSSRPASIRQGNGRQSSAGGDSGVVGSGTGWPAPELLTSITRPLPSAGPALPDAPAPGPSPSHAAAPDYPSMPLGLPDPAARDRSGTWLRLAAAGLAVLAGASAAVSFSAQYRMVEAARRLAVVAGLEAAIPDAAALVFACLGIALALHGRRAVRARFLNVAAIGTSVFMNAIAAAPGWHSLAIWTMPPVAYALASDTLISVVRAWAIARHHAVRTGLADEDTTPLAVLGGLILWVLRLVLAPASTLSGFRAWVTAECPVAPGRRAARPASPEPASTRPHRPGSGKARTARRASRPATKTARFLALVEQRHGPLAGIPLASVARICADLAPQADLDPGAARTALRGAVLSAQKGSSQ